VEHADHREKQYALVLAALNGKADALRRILPLDVDLNAPSPDLFSHATALHHAVWSGSLDAVRVLVDAGADLTAKDRAWQGTPLNWAEHSENEEIASYLKEREKTR
jgi:ankyrin repeat protein